MRKGVVLLGLLALLAGAAWAAGPVIVSAPASDEVTVVRLIYVNYLNMESLMQALGGQCIYLYGGRVQPIGVVKDPGDAMRTFFNGGAKRSGRDNASEPSMTATPPAPSADR